MVPMTFIWWIYHFWTRFWPYFWKHCIFDKWQFDKGQIEKRHLKKVNLIKKKHPHKGISERAFWLRANLKGHFRKGIWWRAFKGMPFLGQGISEGQKGKGHEGHCAWTRIFPGGSNLRVSLTVKRPLLLRLETNTCKLCFRKYSMLFLFKVHDIGPTRLM